MPHMSRMQDLSGGGEAAATDATLARPIGLAAVGDPNDVRTWSGTPYYFLQACIRSGLTMRGLETSLGSSRFITRRAAWTARQILQLRGIRGFQYSNAFLETLWEGCEPGNAILVNFFPLFPASIVTAGRNPLIFYLDQTLRQLFDYYGLGASIHPRDRMSILARERDQYEKAAVIIMQSAWAARSVVADYGISPAKVRVALPCANLDPDVTGQWEQANPGPRLRTEGDPLRLLFVGREWERKGLDRLIGAHAYVLAQGCDVELTIIGVRPEDMPEQHRVHRKVQWLGAIDKRTQMREFVDRAGACDVGCLLSRAEAGGIALCEFVRLGLPTIAPDTGGSPELVVPGASTLVSPTASDAEIGAAILALARDKDRLNAQKRLAWTERRRADWSETARKFGELLAPFGNTRTGGA